MAGQYDDLTAGASIAVGTTGHEGWHEDIHDGLKAREYSEYFVENTGGDMTALIQAAINDAEVDTTPDPDVKGAIVEIDRGINTLATSTTNDRGDKCALNLPKMVWLRGAGGGNGRSGGGAADPQHAASVLSNTATPSLAGGLLYHVVSATNATPDWRGGRISNLHIQDDADHADSILNVTGLNGFMIDYCSFSDNTKAGSYCIRVEESNNDQPTQYGRIDHCNIWANNHGIGMIGNNSTGGNPDWEVHATQIQHQGGATPVSGSTGIYVDTNAFRVFGGEIQFFDIGVHAYGENNRGKHMTLNTVHFEAHQSAADNTFEAAVKITDAGSLSAYNLILACEIANNGKYVDGFNIDTNVVGTKIAFCRVRDARWITSTGDSLITDLSGSTVVV